MRLYNTLTQQTEDFAPAQDHVTMYVCGITPYDTTHLGHAFTYVVFDTLARYFQFKGWPVRYAQNVTDIDDDILRQANQRDEGWKALGKSTWNPYEHNGIEGHDGRGHIFFMDKEMWNGEIRAMVWLREGDNSGLYFRCHPQTETPGDGPVGRVS